jgi:hypothetical protein
MTTFTRAKTDGNQAEEDDMNDATRRPRRRPVPYAARAALPGAGIVRPQDHPPAGAKQWKKWPPREAKEQGQIEISATTSACGEISSDEKQG